MRKVRAATAAAMLALFGAPLTAQQSAAGQRADAEVRALSFDDLQKQAGAAREAKDAAAYLRLVDEFIRRYPQFPRLELARARALAMAGDAAATAAQLNRLAKMGFAFKIDEPEFDKVRSDPRVKTAAARLAANDRPIGRVERAMRLGMARSQPEGVAWSPKEQAFYVGSVPTGTIWRASGTGSQQVYKPAGQIWEPLGMKVSADGSRLFACMNRKGDKPAAALVEFSLPQMTELGRTLLPGGAALCNDVDLLSGGRLAVSDFGRGRLFLWENHKLTELAGDLPFANGVATDGETIYTAYVGGVRVTDLKRRKGYDLNPLNGRIGGMDGLYWHKGALYGVQSIVEPVRIIRITPKHAGSSDADVSVLYAGHGDLKEPTTGAIVGDELAVLSSTGLFSKVENSDPELIFVPLK